MKTKFNAPAEVSSGASSSALMPSNLLKSRSIAAVCRSNENKVNNLNPSRIATKTSKQGA
jgi:hypothetical protein